MFTSLIFTFRSKMAKPNYPTSETAPTDDALAHAMTSHLSLGSSYVTKCDETKYNLPMVPSHSSLYTSKTNDFLPNPDAAPSEHQCHNKSRSGGSGGVPGFPDFPSCWMGEEGGMKMTTSASTQRRGRAKQRRLQRSRRCSSPRRIVRKAVNGNNGALENKKWTKRQQRIERRRKRRMKFQQDRKTRRDLAEISRDLASLTWS